MILYDIKAVCDVCGFEKPLDAGDTNPSSNLPRFMPPMCWWMSWRGELFCQTCIEKRFRLGFIEHHTVRKFEHDLIEGDYQTRVDAVKEILREAGELT